MAEQRDEEMSIFQAGNDTSSEADFPAVNMKRLKSLAASDSASNSTSASTRHREYPDYSRRACVAHPEFLM